MKSEVNMVNVKISQDDMRLYNFITPKTKVLFAHPNNYSSLHYLVQHKKIALHVLDVPITNLKTVTQAGGIFLQGDMNKISKIINPQEFDLVVLGDSFLKYNDIVGVLQKATTLGKYCLIEFKNKSTLQNRINFLINGTIFTKEDKTKWYKNGFQYSCTSSEFINLCISNKLSIDRGCFYDFANKVTNIYLITKLPSLFANRFFFIISADNTVNKQATV